MKDVKDEKAKILEEFGLTRNEVKVYLTLLDLGSALAGDITKKSGIHRRNVYDSIERLIEKGLVSYIVKNNRKIFEAVEPERFLGMLDEWRNELSDMETKINGIIPELKLAKDSARSPHEIQYFKGFEGIKTVHDDILRTGEDYLGYGPAKKMIDALKFFHRHFINMRIKKKIKARFIYEESSKGNPALAKVKLAEVRFLPDNLCSHAAIRVYGDKVALFFLTSEPLAVVIHNDEIADSYRNYFEVMWDAAKAFDVLHEQERTREKFRKADLKTELNKTIKEKIEKNKMKG